MWRARRGGKWVLLSLQSQNWTRLVEIRQLKAPGGSTEAVRLHGSRLYLASVATMGTASSLLSQVARHLGTVNSDAVGALHRVKPLHPVSSCVGTNGAMGTRYCRVPG
jgi:hypothetical protein